MAPQWIDGLRRPLPNRAGHLKRRRDLCWISVATQKRNSRLKCRRWPAPLTAASRFAKSIQNPGYKLESSREIVSEWFEKPWLTTATVQHTEGLKGGADKLLIRLPCYGTSNLTVLKTGMSDHLISNLVSPLALSGPPSLIQESLQPFSMWDP